MGKFKKSFSLLHLLGLRPRVYYTLTNFRGVGDETPQHANDICTNMKILEYVFKNIIKIIIYSKILGKCTPKNTNLNNLKNISGEYASIPLIIDRSSSNTLWII